jgi:hypothetical protein
MSRDNALDLRIIAYLSGDISESDQEELETELGQDASARDRFALLCREDIALYRLLRLAQPQEKEPELPRPAEGRVASRRGRGSRGVRRIPHRSSGAIRPALLTAAGILIGLLLWSAVSRSTPVGRDVRSVRTSRTAGTPEPLAQRSIEPPPTAPLERIREVGSNGGPQDRLDQPTSLSSAQPEPPEVRPLSRPEIPPPPKPAPTVVALASLEEVRGDVVVITGSENSPAVVGQKLQSGQGLGTRGRDARAAILFPDGTRCELGRETIISRMDERSLQGGKSIALANGIVSFRVARQMPDLPLIISTPHAEARVLGTTLRLFVDSEAGGGTRLEVDEGRVRFVRSADGSGVDVSAGSSAVVQGGVGLAPRAERLLWSSRFSTKDLAKGELGTLKEKSGEIFTISSVPSKMPGWDEMDGTLFFEGNPSPFGPLFLVPERMEIRMRIRSERAGRVLFHMREVSSKGTRAFSPRDFQPVGPEWRTVLFRTDDFTGEDRLPLKAGTTISSFNLHTFGPGKVWVSRIDIVSVQARK